MARKGLFLPACYTAHAGGGIFSKAHVTRNALAAGERRRGGGDMLTLQRHLAERGGRCVTGGLNLISHWVVGTWWGPGGTYGSIGGGRMYMYRIRRGGVVHSSRIF